MRRVLVLLVAGTLLSGFAATYASVKQPLTASTEGPSRPVR